MEVIQIVQTNPGFENICLQKVEFTKAAQDQVIVEMIKSPINPADLSFIAGAYPNSPPFPRLLGHEGTGVVVDAGEKVKHLKVGDSVILIKGHGSFSSHIKKEETAFLKIPKWIPAGMACFLRTSIMSAFCLIHDFVPKDQLNTLIQNGANSAVGLSVIHLSKLKNIKTINVIRNPELKEELLKRGGDFVLLENEFFEGMDFNKLPKANLALDCVGGSYGLAFSKILSQNAVMVTYGAMSKKTLEIEGRSLIFQNLSLKGFWLTRWLENLPYIEAIKSFNELFGLLQEEPINIPIEKKFLLSAFQEALNSAKQSSRKGKIIFSKSE